MVSPGPKDVLIVAGEASGDLFGSLLAAQARAQDPGLRFYGLGGPRMEAAGVELMFDLSGQQHVGLTEVISSLGDILATMKALEKSIVQRKPAAVVLIDYPGFNLRLARRAKLLGVPVFYYISPQLWAWRAGRARQVKKWVDRMVTVFPFEPEFYAAHGVEAEYVGHPLLDVLPEPRPKPGAKAALGLDPHRPLLLLQPGSRASEIRQVLPVMIEAAALVAQNVPGLSLALARAETIEDELLAPLLSTCPLEIQVFAGATHALQNAADVVLTASGTATLETALALTPMVVVYRVSWLTYHLARLLVNARYLAMPNILADRQIAPEFLQARMRPGPVAEAVTRLFRDEAARNLAIEGLDEVRRRLGGPSASGRAASLLLDMIAKGV